MKEGRECDMSREQTWDEIPGAQMGCLEISIYPVDLIK